MWGWREGPVVKNTNCSSRRPGLNSQHPDSSWQTPVTPVQEDPTPSSSLQQQSIRAHGVKTPRQNGYIHKNKSILQKRKANNQKTRKQ